MTASVVVAVLLRTNQLPPVGEMPPLNQRLPSKKSGYAGDHGEEAAFRLCQFVLLV